MVRILLLRMMSTITLPRSDVFPLLRVPAISNVLLPSIKKFITPAASGLIIFVFINNGKVQGLSRWRRKEYASPVGLSGAVMAATLALACGKISSVSKIGFASSSGRPEIILNFDAQLSPSGALG